MAFRALGRVLCWNALLTATGLGLLALAGEAWIRTIPSLEPQIQPWVFVPGLGAHYAPHAAIRVISVDFQRTSRTNSMGFLDRKPPSPEAARATCHVAVVGDSFVVARSMALADKFHVQMEKMAARRLPHLDVTTAAYGVVGSGQVHQLAFWDRWLRRRPPRLVVLVAVGNDFAENRPRRVPPYRFGFVQEDDGRFVLAAPFLDGTRWNPGGPVRSAMSALWHRTPPALRPWGAHWIARELSELRTPGNREALPIESARFTALALDQWRERTTQAGAALVVLGSSNMAWERKTPGGANALDQFRRIAEERGIPFVDQVQYVQENWGEGKDVYQIDDALHWPADGHWNAVGHRWAAEALVDHVARNPQVCAGRGRCPGADLEREDGRCE